MGKVGERGGPPFWRAGGEPVRPVRAFKRTEESGGGSKEVRKETMKEKRGAEYG